MKTQTALLLLGAASLALPTLTRAQLGGDPTTPPAGVPGRVMKTLDQVEARIPLVDGAPGVTLEANGGYKITAKGSYYLTGDLSVSSGYPIEIRAHFVSIDLNGFTIEATNPLVCAFFITGATDQLIPNLGVKISNGFISSAYTYSNNTVVGGGFNLAINPTVGSVVEVKNLTVIGTPMSFTNLTSVVDSSVQYSNGQGIYADSVENSVAKFCQGIAIRGNNITNSTGRSLTAAGVIGFNVQNSDGQSAGSGAGISGTTVINSYGRSTNGFGIIASVVTNCRGLSTNNSGISAKVVTNSYGSTNSASDTHHGIEAEGTVSFSYGTVDSDTNPTGGDPINAPTVVSSTEIFED